ncbi:MULTISPECIES: gluconeogenesis factor YvcK family protein [Bacillaceae]|uniref:Gluconeogenesis factor n=1 Tax=Evansella alkalicola TaxID=745819 RepID=A0ABS6JUY3_9BACI|nr:YvcK family protein [Litchfieldia alkalitelluris]MBU9722230.1 YvcK family protein [Bacillus alkalicola]
MKKANIVVIGGGTGLSVLLKGLKTFPVDITAIVTVADDGGSSGRLRKELRIPPPGDVRNVLVALAEVEPLVEELFQHRFENGNGLSGHSLGNLLLAGMTSITGDFARGVQEISRVLNVKGKVLPAANEEIILHAELEDGTFVEGESNIPLAGKKVKRVFLEPNNPEPLQETLIALEKADLIVLGPGSLYTSIIPNLLVPGIADVIMKSTATKVYICNVMTQPGETDEFKASDHVQAIYEHIGENIIHSILVNGQNIPFSYAQRYAGQGAKQVEVDYDGLQKLGLDIISDDLLYFDNYLLRHDAIKLSQRLLSML